MSITTKESHTQHISQQFNQDLAELRSHLLAMGGAVARQMSDAVEALLKGDTGLATQVRKKEEEVNQMELSIDEECTQIIAKRQPAASDLRLVLSIIKTVGDLERIGDEASKIARLAIELAEEGQSPRGYVEVRHICDHVRRMLDSALDAFARFDPVFAFEVIEEDKQVDAEYRTAMRSLMMYMLEDPRSITQVHNVIWVLRALERIGDHASNVAEHVVFMVSGKDIRHMEIEDASTLIKNKI